MNLMELGAAITAAKEQLNEARLNIIEIQKAVEKHSGNDLNFINSELSIITNDIHERTFSLDIISLTTIEDEIENMINHLEEN